MIVNCNEPYHLSKVICDFKKYTSRKILKQIQVDQEPRKEWLLHVFQQAAVKHSKTKNYKFWMDGNHAIELYNSNFTWRKVTYIHQNPVKAGFVEQMGEWDYSSARNYLGEAGQLEEVICLTPPLITIS